MWTNTSLFTITKIQPISQLTHHFRSQNKKEEEEIDFDSFKYFTIFYELYTNYILIWRNHWGYIVLDLVKNSPLSSKIKNHFYTLLMYFINSLYSFMHSLSLNIYLNSFHHLYHLYTCLWSFIMFLLLYWNCIYCWRIGGKRLEYILELIEGF